MQTLWQDLKFARRMLKRNPGFTAVALLTLALGIGSNTVIFSAVNAVLLRPFPYSDPARLLAITQTERTTGRTGGPMSFTKFSAIVEQSKSLESTATAYPRSVSLVSDREPELVNAARVSQDFFHVLGVPLARGRAFLREEEVPGGNDFAVISDAFWHNHFAGDAGVIGKSLFLDGKSVSVVGILPASLPDPGQQIPQFTFSDAARAITEAVRPFGSQYLGEMEALLDPRNGRLDVVPSEFNVRGPGFFNGGAGRRVSSIWNRSRAHWRTYWVLPTKLATPSSSC